MLVELGIRGFRCLADQRLALGPGLNLIYGDNAAGKTSLLEALFWLGRGRSFRGATARECLRRGEAGWSLQARVVPESDRPADRFVLAFEAGQLRLSSNGERMGLIAAARCLPVQLVEPGLHRLIEDGPAQRRRFLDWGLFHVEPSYLALWRRQSRALRQRNALLRRGARAAELAAWDREYVASAEALHAVREQGIASLQAAFDQRCRALALPEAELRLLPGWPADQTLGAALATRQETDQQQGRTSVGPHRAELRVRLSGVAARGQASRGQQKLLVAALALAQADVLQAVRGSAPLLLVDDFGAELGGAFQHQLGQALTEYAGQCVVTALLPPPLAGARRFHVEQGRVTQEAPGGQAVRKS